MDDQAGGPFNTFNPPGEPGVYGDMILDPPEQDPAVQEVFSVKQNLQGANAGGSGSAIFPVPMVSSGNTRVESGPPVRIGPRDLVVISPFDINVSICYFSTAGPDSARLSAGPRVALPAPTNFATGGTMTQRVVKVRNLNEIYIYSPAPNEGAYIEVQFAEGRD